MKVINIYPTIALSVTKDGPELKVNKLSSSGLNFCYFFNITVNCFFVRPIVNSLPLGTHGRKIRRSKRTFASMNEAWEELGPLPKIVHVSSLASYVDIKFSKSLIDLMRVQRNRFFYSLPVHKQLKILTRLKCTPIDQISYLELARDVDVPAEKLKGWLSVMKNRVFKISSLGKVPQMKIDVLNDEFSLSDTLSNDRLLLLSHILKIDEKVVQQFFDTKRDSKNSLIVRPAAASGTLELSHNNPTAFENLLFPCVKLYRCSIPEGKATDSAVKSRRKIFTPEQLTILRDKYSQLDCLGSEEADRTASQFGGTVTRLNIMSWFSKTRYRKNLSKRTQSIAEKCKPYSSRKHKKQSPVPVDVQNALFEEYKKSSVLTTHRRDALQRNLRVSSNRIERFFNKMSALLCGKTENDITKLLSSHPKALLTKIAAEQRHSRYISVMRSQKLAKQLGTSRRVIIDWFSNARLYELLSGNRFHPIAKPSPTSTPLLIHQNRRETSLQAVVQKTVSASNEAANTKASRRSNDQIKKKKVPKRASRCYQSSSREILFDAFKQSSRLSPSTVAQITSVTSLSTPQIDLWFSRTRKTLRFVASEKLIFQSEYRNQYFQPEHIVVLEQEFQKHPYDNEAIRNELAKKLNVGKGTIQSWFAKRRHYELILFGMPELVDVGKSETLSEMHNVTDEVNKAAVFLKPDYSQSPSEEMATSLCEVQMYQLEDVSSDDFNGNCQPFDNCDLLNASEVKTETSSLEFNSNENSDAHSETDDAPKKQGYSPIPVFEIQEPSVVKLEPSPTDVRTHLPQPTVSSNENSDTLREIDDASERQANSLLLLSEILEPSVDKLEPSTNDVENRLPQHPSMEDDANADSQLNVCEVPKSSSICALYAEEDLHLGMEVTETSPTEIGSNKKNVAVYETVAVIPEKPADISEPMPNVSKPLVDYLKVDNTVATTPKELANGVLPLPDVSKSLVDHLEVDNTIAATPEELSNDVLPLPDVSKPLIGHSEVCKTIIFTPEELPDGPESLSKVSKPLDDCLAVGNTVAATREELSNGFLPLPDISKPPIGHLELCKTTASSSKEPPDGSQSLPDISMPLVDGLEVDKTVTANPEEIQVCVKQLSDAPQQLVGHSEVFANGLATRIDKERKCSSIVLPTSSTNSTKPLESVSNVLPAKPIKKKILISAIQRKKLVQEYKKSPFVSTTKAQILANDINLSEKQIFTWFKRKFYKNVTSFKSPKLVEEKFKQMESSRTLTPFQLFVLEREFVENSKLTKKRLKNLCQKLRSTGKPIIAWFKERNKKADAEM